MTKRWFHFVPKNEAIVKKNEASATRRAPIFFSIRRQPAAGAPSIGAPRFQFRSTCQRHACYRMRHLLAALFASTRMTCHRVSGLGTLVPATPHLGSKLPSSAPGQRPDGTVGTNGTNVFASFSLRFHRLFVDITAAHAAKPCQAPHIGALLTRQEDKSIRGRGTGGIFPSVLGGGKFSGGVLRPLRPFAGTCRKVGNLARRAVGPSATCRRFADWACVRPSNAPCLA